MKVYRPKVDHWVKHAHWDDNFSVLVTAVGRDRFLALDDHSHEDSYLIEGPWVRFKS